MRIHKSIEVFIIFFYLRPFFVTHRSVEEYTKSGRDKMVVDPDPDEIYSKQKKRNISQAALLRRRQARSIQVMAGGGLRRGCLPLLVQK